MKKKDCTIYDAKRKVLISCAVTIQLICIFALAFHDRAHLIPAIFCRVIRFNVLIALFSLTNQISYTLGNMKNCELMIESAAEEIRCVFDDI